MKSQNLIKYVAYTVSGTYALILFILGIQLPNVAVKLLSTLPLVLVLLFILFDRWLWRRKPFWFFVRRRPRLGGTWRGLLTAVRLDDNCNEISVDIPVFFEIHQTFSELSIALMSRESESRSMTADLVSDSHGRFILWYQYQGVPGIEVRARSPIHFGGSRVDISERDPKTFTGEYWTDRMTRGSYTAELISASFLGSFGAAEAFVGEDL